MFLNKCLSIKQINYQHQQNKKQTWNNSQETEIIHCSSDTPPFWIAATSSSQDGPNSLLLVGSQASGKTCAVPTCFSLLNLYTLPVILENLQRFPGPFQEPINPRRHAISLWFSRLSLLVGLFPVASFPPQFRAKQKSVSHSPFLESLATRISKIKSTPKYMSLHMCLLSGFHLDSGLFSCSTLVSQGSPRPLISASKPWTPLRGDSAATQPPNLPYFSLPHFSKRTPLAELFTRGSQHPSLLTQHFDPRPHIAYWVCLKK